MPSLGERLVAFGRKVVSAQPVSPDERAMTRFPRTHIVQRLRQAKDNCLPEGYLAHVLPKPERETTEIISELVSQGLVERQHSVDTSGTNHLIVCLTPSSP